MASSPHHHHHHHYHHRWIDKNIKNKQTKKSRRKRRHSAHTLWLTADAWEARWCRQLHRSNGRAKDGDGSVKKSPRLLRPMKLFQNNDSTMRHYIELRYFPSLPYLQPWQCVSDGRDVKQTTVSSVWWRIVYWSGSLCLCELFDIHATFTSSWWEGKLLFLASRSLSLYVCVFISVRSHTHSAQRAHM